MINDMMEYMRARIHLSLPLLLLGIGTHQAARAQASIDRAAIAAAQIEDSIPLIDVLKSLSEKYKVYFSYDVALVKAHTVLSKTLQEQGVRGSIKSYCWSRIFSVLEMR